MVNDVTSLIIGAIIFVLVLVGFCILLDKNEF